MQEEGEGQEGKEEGYEEGEEVGNGLGLLSNRPLTNCIVVFGRRSVLYNTGNRIERRRGYGGCVFMGYLDDESNAPINTIGIVCCCHDPTPMKVATHRICKGTYES